MSEIALPSPAEPDYKSPYLSLPLGNRLHLQLAGLLIAVSVVSASIGWFMFPYTMVLTRLKLTETGVANSTVDRVMESAAQWRRLTFVTTPIVEVAKVAVVAGLILAIHWLVDAPIGYASSLWIAGWIEVAAALRRVTSLVIITRRGLSAIHNAGDLNPPVGIDILLGPRANVFLQTIGSFLNPFDIAAGVFLYFATRRTTKSAGSAAYVTATVAAILFAIRMLMFNLSS